MKTVDMKAYQQVIEAELKKHFETDPTLKKIRAGEPVSDADLQALSLTGTDTKPECRAGRC